MGELSARQMSASKSDPVRVRTKQFGGSIVRLFASLNKKSQ